ncbi:type II toxin-antitoxin system VapC family toxin [Caulobacter sp. 602-2]|uniref:Ribonuclease VapC n=1 Tax=Caulobacter sp. 602-2 TaxID=2710887 RepID=A0A6G4QZQ9_9CAUL|nr:type II toxin-antitoxin system VapC family toxin [Caulobacter sp. 602-2]
MRQVVLDASAALAWLLPTQATPAARTLLAESNALIFEAPSIFEWEVRNVLLTLARRGVLVDDEYEKAVATYEDLSVRFSEPAFGVEGLAILARHAKLSLFDAAYLALAAEHDWPLASRDDALLKAAADVGIECFDLRATTP